MNTDAEILHKILANRIKQYIKSKMHHDQISHVFLVVSQESKLSLAYAKPVNVINHINRLIRKIKYLFKKIQENHLKKINQQHS